MNERTQHRPQQQQTRTAEPSAKQQMPPPAGAGSQAPALLPDPIARRGISEAQWRTLKNNLYPGATNDSCLMVWDYCIARKLDPMKKPCHIVPMEVEVKTKDEDGRIKRHKEWRDVVMPGIYEYRTTAMRTGLYLGHSEPEYGPRRDIYGVRDAPEWCKMTFLRWNEKAARVTEFPSIVWFEEICATKRLDDGSLVANARWMKADNQMIEKCTEAAGLRKAFPDEIGGEHTIEEMEGRVLGSDDDSRTVMTVPAGTTRTESAKEVLRARQQQNVEPRSETGQRAAETVSRPAQANVATKQAEADPDSIPWEEEPEPQAAASAQQSATTVQYPAPGADKEWVETLRAAAKESLESLKAAWERCVDLHDDAHKEVSVNVQAVYEVLLDHMRGK